MATHALMRCRPPRAAGQARAGGGAAGGRLGWQELMLSPHDYSKEAIFHPVTRRFVPGASSVRGCLPRLTQVSPWSLLPPRRSLMAKIAFAHGGPDYDARYPDGIPTSVVIVGADGAPRASGLVMYPAGHARNTTADLDAILGTKARF